MFLDSLRRTMAIARATTLDLARRPGGALALLGCAVLLLLVPALATRALDAGSGLAVELALSTISLFVVLEAAVWGPTFADPAEAPGPTTETYASPLGPTEFVAGRVLGALLVIAAHVAALSIVALLAIRGALPDADLPLVGWATATATAGTQCFLVVTLGLAAASLVGRQVGLILSLAYVALARVAPSGLLSNRLLAAALPDPMRLELARDVALGHSLSPTLVGIAVLAALVQGGGLALFAAHRLAPDRLDDA